MAKIIRTADVERWLKAEGWDRIHRTTGTIVFRDARGTLLPIPLHPTRPDLIYLEDLIPRVPLLKQEFIIAAFEEIPFDGFGFELLIDTGEDRAAEVFDALSELHATLGGSMLVFDFEDHHAHHGGSGSMNGTAFRRCRAQIDPQTPLDIRREIKAVLLAIGCILTRVSGVTIDEHHKAPEIIYRALRQENARMLASSTGGGVTKGRVERMGVAASDVRAALDSLVSRVNAVRQTGGGIAIVKEDMERQFEQAVQEFPDDPALTGMLSALAYGRLKNANRLPSAPDTAVQLMTITQNDDYSMDDVVNVIQQDPAMTARIMQHANSSYVGLRIPADSLKRAILPLGLQTVRSLALAFSLVSENRTGTCATFDYDLYWKESSARAAAARHVAAAVRCGIDPDEALAAGLLSQLGRLAFATALPEEYAKVLDQVNPTIPNHLLHLERHAFGIDNQELAAEMMADWGLSEFFWQAVQTQSQAMDENLAPVDNKTRTLAQILAWTTTMWRLMSTPKTPVRADERWHVINQAHQIGLPENKFSDDYDQVQDDYHELAGVLDVKPLPVRTWADLTQ